MTHLTDRRTKERINKTIEQLRFYGVTADRFISEYANKPRVRCDNKKSEPLVVGGYFRGAISVLESLRKGGKDSVARLRGAHDDEMARLRVNADEDAINRHLAAGCLGSGMAKPLASRIAWRPIPALTNQSDKPEEITCGVYRFYPGSTPEESAPATQTIE